MKCPVCKDVTLLMSEKRGVEIDYCPECRGIWLDRGELEKLVEKEEQNYRDQADRREERHSEKAHSSSSRRDYDDYDRDYEKSKKYNKNYQKNYKKRKRESVFGEIFDLFGGDD